MTVGSATGDFICGVRTGARFVYDDPIDIVLITTRVWLHVDEPSRRTVTSYPISETPLKIFSTKQCACTTKASQPLPRAKTGVLSVRLAKPAGRDAGVILLEFSEKPFALRRWTITDSTGLTTRWRSKYRNGDGTPRKAIRADQLCRPKMAVEGGL